MDTKSGKMLTKQTIVVKENKILSVLDGYLLPKGAKSIDLRDKVVMPGLIDFHVHIEKEFDRNTRLNRYIMN